MKWFQGLSRANPAVVEDTAERLVRLEAQSIVEEEHAAWTDQHDSGLFMTLLILEGDRYGLIAAACAAYYSRERTATFVCKQASIVCCPNMTEAA